MRYVGAVLALTSKTKTVTIAGRGRKIYRVVGIAEILKRRNFKVEKIEIGTESFKDENGIQRNKSFMKIKMRKLNATRKKS